MTAAIISKRNIGSQRVWRTVLRKLSFFCGISSFLPYCCCRLVTSSWVSPCQVLLSAFHKRILRFPLLKSITVSWFPLWHFIWGRIRSQIGLFPKNGIKIAHPWNIRTVPQICSKNTFCCRLQRDPAPRPYGHRLLSLYCWSRILLNVMQCKEN